MLCVFYVPIVYVTSSTHVLHRVGLRDEMRWSPYIEDQWIARVPADQVCRNITGVNIDFFCISDGEIVEWNLWQEKLEKLGEKPTQALFHPPWNPHGVTKIRTSNPTVGGERPKIYCICVLYMYRPSTTTLNSTHCISLLKWLHLLKFQDYNGQGMCKEWQNMRCPRKLWEINLKGKGV